MNMYKLTIDKQALTLNEWATLLKEGDVGHKLIWKAFGTDPDKARNFIFRMDAQPNHLTFHAVSADAPSTWNGRFEVHQKPYTPDLHKGQRLRFQLRTNPSVSVKTQQGSTQRGKRHDAVSHAKMVDKRDGTARFEGMSQAEIVQEVGTAWIKKKLERVGFETQDVLVQAYANANFMNKSARTKKRNNVQFGIMDCTGTVIVNDPTHAKEALLQGIGRQKAFGLGLMMVAPA